MKILVRNYQSIDRAELDCSGFTTVVGPSNAGKSALIRAITAALTGQRGDHFIRHGENVAGVKLEGPGYKIIWKKVKKATVEHQTQLQVNSSIHSKLGYDHGLLTEPVGFKTLEVGSVRLKPQFAGQFDPTFLLAETETTVAEVFRLIGRADIVTNAQAMAKKDLTSTESMRKVREQDLIRSKTELAELDDVPILRAKLEAAKAEHNRIADRTSGREALIAKIKTLQTLEPKAIPTPIKHPLPPPAFFLIDKLRNWQRLEPKALPDPILPVSLPGARLAKIELLGKFKTEDKELKALTSLKTEAQQQIDRLREEIEAAEREIGACPTCGRLFDGHEHMAA